MTQDCTAVSKRPEWLKKPFDAALKELGQPLSSEEFDLDKAVITEFRGGLSGLQSKSRGKGVHIREATWAQGDCRLTLWFQQTPAGHIAIDTLYWNKDTEF